MFLPLDSIATIFIFLIGLPAILLQTLPTEIRRTVLRARKQEVAMFTVGPVVLAGVLLVTGVYLTYPGDGAVTAADQARAEIIWLVLVTLLLLVAGGAALVLTDRWRRVSVVSRLEQRAAVGVTQRGRPLEDTLHTLIDLGIQSRPGQDKKLVIEALASLTAKTQEAKGYNGAQLEMVVNGLEWIFSAGAHMGSAGNFKSAAEMLDSLIEGCRDSAITDDLKLSIQATSLLGRLSLRYEQPDIQIAFLEALEFAGYADELGRVEWASDAIFEIGSDALDANRVLVAMAALDKLDSVVSRREPIEDELAHHLIGLLAHFWDAGESCRDYARDFLTQSESLFAHPLPTVIARAREEFLEKSRFRTREHLARLGRDLKTRRGHPRPYLKKRGNRWQ